MEKKFIPVKDLEVYRLARELSKIAWEIYDCLELNFHRISTNFNRISIVFP
jgi:hypothetical protein